MDGPKVSSESAFYDRVLGETRIPQCFYAVNIWFLYQIWSLKHSCRHPRVLSSSEQPGHRRGCHLYEHPPFMTAHHQHLSDTDGSAYNVYRRPVHQEYWPNMCPSCPKPTWMVLSQRLGLTRTLASWAWTHKGMRSEGVESHFQWIHPKRGQGYMSRRGTYGSRSGEGRCNQPKCLRHSVCEWDDGHAGRQTPEQQQPQQQRRSSSGARVDEGRHHM